ncbi:MAG TPA: c-type cytochrome [Pyrinomonadaceae bacterium]|nr:c-type cytochrome [Pyrinomonadaceae bacterium]
MKHLVQAIAASGLAVPLLLLSWAGAVERVKGTPRATAQAGKTERDARLIFDGKCATCHGRDGRAKTLKAKFNKARDLTDAAWQAEASDERIYNSISNGRGKKMPALAKKLSRAEMEALVVHVRSLKK